MKKIIKNNLLGFIIGAIIFGSIGVFATNYLLKAEDVEYRDNKNLQDAIDELYGMASNPKGLPLFKLQANGDPTSTASTIAINFMKVEPTTPTITCRAKNASGNIVGTGTITDNTCTITGLQPETPYTYEIIRTDQNGVTDTLIGIKSTTQVGPTIQTTNLVSSIGTTYQGLLGIVYLDPTDLSASCNASNSVSTTGTKTGCMKWYAYKLENGNYSLLLDHNVVARSYYNSNNIATSMGTRSASSLGKTYNEIGYDLAQLTSTSGWKVTPRLISANEVSTITNQSIGNNYNGNGAGQTKGSNVYAWLFDRTYNCEIYGCNLRDDSTFGYWTSTAATGSNGVWGVYCTNQMTARSANDSYADDGLRPVIEVSTNLF